MFCHQCGHLEKLKHSATRDLMKQAHATNIRNGSGFRVDKWIKRWRSAWGAGLKEWGRRGWGQNGVESGWHLLGLEENKTFGQHWHSWGSNSGGAGQRWGKMESSMQQILALMNSKIHKSAKKGGNNEGSYW